MIVILATLATWRITVTLLDFDGPLHILRKIRRKFDSDLTTCFHCLSTWVALPFALYLSSGEFILYWFAIAGGASIINVIYEKF